MVRLGKRLTAAAAAGMLAVSCMTGCGSASALNTEEVVATVGGEEVTLGVANFYARMIQGQYETYYAGMMGTTADQMWSQEFSEGMTMEDSVKDSILKTIEEMYVIAQHTEEYDVALSDEEKAVIEETAETFLADNTDHALASVSGDKEIVKKILELSSIQSKMTEKMREGVDEEVSDEEAAQKSMQYAFFAYSSTDEDGNSIDLSEEDKAVLKESARSLVDRARAGEDFETVAGELSANVSTASFDAESTSPNADLIAAADGLTEEGGITDVIETDQGVYVAKLTSLFDREATDKKKENIVEQRRQEQYSSLLEEWTEAADIKEEDRVWKKVSFSDLGITIKDTSADE